MLAHVLDDARLARAAFPMTAQPKLDGVRMMAVMRRGKLVALHSRAGNAFEHLMRTFRAELEAAASPARGAPDELVFDGELYVHGVGFQRIVSMVKGHAAATASPRLRRGSGGSGKQLQYHVYDVYLPGVPSMPFAERAALLARLLLLLRPPAAVMEDRTRLVRLVASKPVSSPKGVTAALRAFEAAGYEGVMLRDPAAPYTPGRRSPALLKLKSFQDAEFQIVGFQEASGADRGTVVFVCRVGDGPGPGSGREFHVRPMGTREQRARMLRDAPGLVGKPLTVRFQELTDGGVPRFPVGVAVRDYEGGLRAPLDPPPLTIRGGAAPPLSPPPLTIRGGAAPPLTPPTDHTRGGCAPLTPPTDHTRVRLGSGFLLFIGRPQTRSRQTSPLRPLLLRPHLPSSPTTSGWRTKAQTAVTGPKPRRPRPGTARGCRGT